MSGLTEDEGSAPMRKSAAARILSQLFDSCMEELLGILLILGAVLAGAIAYFYWLR